MVSTPSINAIYSVVQQECIPQAVLGMDVLCQAKSGHGKTAVFVLATLQQLEPVNGEVSVIVLCHTRELAFQIKNEYTRFAKYMPDVRVHTFYGGTPVQKDAELLRDKSRCPHIVVATPGRLNALVRDKILDAKNVKHFTLDECDKMLEQLGQSKAKFGYLRCLHSPPLSLTALALSLLCRHAPGCPRDLPCNATPQTSHDVQCHSVKGYPCHLQEVHGECNCPLCIVLICPHDPLSDDHSLSKYSSMMRQS